MERVVITGMCRAVAISSLILGVVTCASSQVISNGSFEHARVNPNSWVGGGEAEGWIFNACSGIARGDGAWGRRAHSGEQYAYLQSRGDGVGLISQVITGLTVGQKYRISFWLARRNTTYGPIASANVATPIEVLIDDAIVLGPTAPSGVGEWLPYATQPFRAKTSGITLTFLALTSKDSHDRSTLIDDVTITPMTATSHRRKAPYQIFLATPKETIMHLSKSQTWSGEKVATNLTHKFPDQFVRASTQLESWTPRNRLEFDAGQPRGFENAQVPRRRSPNSSANRPLPVFPSEIGQSEIADRAHRSGFTVTKGEDPDQPNAYGLALNKVDSVDESTIAAITNQMQSWAQEFGGNYDGWGAPVCRPPKKSLLDRIFKRD